ncbi:MAG: MFS transporter [Hyphomicrobiaceae bacterium]
MTTTRAAGLFYGWRVVAACFVIAAVTWALGLFGASVYLQAVTAAHGWPVAEVSFAITLFFLVSASIQRLVGRSIDRYGPRPVLTIGASCLGLGVALIGQVGAPWQLYPCFVLVGIGWSTLSTTGISATVAPWFERHQGRSMTLAIMGASVGAIAGVPLLLLALRSLGLDRGLIAAGLVAVVVLLPLVWGVLRYRGPADLGLARDGLPVAGAASGQPTRTAAAGAKTGRPGVLLWTAAAGFALALTVQIGFITHHVALASPLVGTGAAGWLVSATGVTAFAGRLILARIVDRVDVRRLAMTILLVQTGALLALAAWPTVPVLVAASLVYGYGIGHITTLGPVVVRREFGAEAFGATYGAAATVIQLTSALGPALLGLLRDGFGGYRPGLAIAAGVTTAACLALLAGRRLGGRAAAAAEVG